MKAPARRTEQHEPVAALAIGEYPGTPIRGQTEQEGHDGFLAHIRGPEDEAGKEKKEVAVAAATGAPERRGEGAIEEDDPDKGEKAEDEEGTQLVDPDDGEHHPSHDAHRAVGHDARKVGRRQRKVEMAKAVRQNCPLGDVAVVVGNSPVDVVNDPDLGRRTGQVEQQADGEGLRQPGVVARHASDDGLPENEQRYRNENGDNYQGKRGPIDIMPAPWPAQASGGGAFMSAG